MLCAVCLSVDVKRQDHQDAPGGTEGGSGPTCERCGRNLDGDLVDRMAAKLSQLARFGLTGRPILSRRRP